MPYLLWPKWKQEARQVLKEEGIKALEQHARVGRMCRCHYCFCCAAAQVLSEVQNKRIGEHRD